VAEEKRFPCRSGAGVPASPMATATAMYHSGKNPLKKISRSSEEVIVPKGTRVRRLHKAFLRYHDPDNWPVLRERSSAWVAPI